MITVLFTQKYSIYEKLNCDCYDINRDALSFKGTNSVIAHPPCRAWGKLKGVAKPRPGEKELAIYALNVIRKNGGILEHPSSSDIFKFHGLPKPGSIDEFGGFVIHVNQHWFGHKAEKRTGLYIVGIEPRSIPDYTLNFNAVTHVVSTVSKMNGRKELSKKGREATPELLAKWLIELCNQIECIKVNSR